MCNLLWSAIYSTYIDTAAVVSIILSPLSLHCCSCRAGEEGSWQEREREREREEEEERKTRQTQGRWPQRASLTGGRKQLGRRRSPLSNDVLVFL